MTVDPRRPGLDPLLAAWALIFATILVVVAACVVFALARV